MLEFAKSLARRSGELLLEHMSQRRSISFKSTDRDLVTDADRASEQWLVEAIRHHYPDHNIVGEEGTGELSMLQAGGYTWVLDPLDGTVNYAHQLPIFCVSVALLQDGVPVLGAIYAPRLDEMYCAELGKGATLNDRPIQVSVTDRLQDAVLATGFAYDKHISERNNLENFCAFTRQVRGIRRLGAAALDLCFVASGRLDGYWEEKLQPWDVAAGILIVEEAGGQITNYAGQPLRLQDGHVLASNKHLHPVMQNTLQPYTEKYQLFYTDE